MDQFLEAGWGRSTEEISTEVSTKLKNNLYRSIAQESEVIQQKAINHFSFLKIAAAIALLIAFGAGLFYVYNYRNQVNEQWVRIDNQGSKIKSVSMPDNSIIWLNANSSISYSNLYNTTKRELKLSGEAFFQVTKNHQKPFIVHSGNISTTALGTSFNISAYEKDQIVRVVLVTGKVAVDLKKSFNNEKRVILTPGKMIEFENKNAKWTSSMINTNSVTLWRNNKLVFVNELLPDALRKLARHYHVNIRFNEEELSHLYFDGTFESTEEKERVLKTVLSIYGLTYKTTPNGYEILKNKK
ncbi:fec operon regulator FecR [compost metagenome]